MKRNKIIKQIKKDIKELEGIKKSGYKDLEDAHKLPDDPSIGQDVFNDGILNQNPELKMTYVGNRNHTVGYCEGAIVKLKEMMFFLTVSKKEYKKYKKEQSEIKKHNKKTFKKLKKKIVKNEKLVKKDK